MITIDGPVASGKSTMARLLAQHLGYYYINSGLLFRAMAYICAQYGSDKNVGSKSIGTEPIGTEIFCTEEELVALIKSHSIVYTFDQQAHIFVDGVDVTPQLKSAAIDRAASLISTYSGIRDIVLSMQREIAEDHNVVVEGRDAGTVVFPDADMSFFLTAPLAVRADRWRMNQVAKGVSFTSDQAQAAVLERDERDSSRSCAPLRIPEGAVTVDTGMRSVEDVLTELVALSGSKD